MIKPPPIRFTEPTEAELLAVTPAELQLAAIVMSGVSDSFNRYIRTKEKGGIKPCLQRVL